MVMADSATLAKCHYCGQMVEGREPCMCPKCQGMKRLVRDAVEGVLAEDYRIRMALPSAD
jgi:primosomal protein N'